MTDIGLAAVEQRMTILEAELRRTQARVRDLEEGRRWMARQCVLIMSGVAVLILVFGFAVPTRGAGPATVTAPFTVVGASGDTLR